MQPTFHIVLFVYAVITSCCHLNSAVPLLSTALEMPIEVRPKSKHPSMKKARGGDRFDALESESLLPPALR